MHGMKNTSAKKMHKCNFCKKKITSFKVINYFDNLKEGKFLNCSSCKIYINNKIYRKIYTSKKTNLNSYLNKNILYYLKSIFLYLYFLKLKKFFPKKNNIILDYGSGSGEFSNIMSQSKNKIFASDFTFNKLLYNKKVSFIKIEKLFIKKNKKKFNVIFLRHVLEHIYDFNKLIPKLKLLLKNNGKIIIEVPNYDSFWKKVLKSKWPGFFYPYHHYVFSEKFLIKIFKIHKLKIVKTNFVEPPIFGSYFSSIGINRSLSKILSLFFYPIQFLISKFNFSSEGILFILKK